MILMYVDCRVDWIVKYIDMFWIFKFR